MRYLAYITLGMVIGAVIGVAAYAATAPPPRAPGTAETETVTVVYTSTVTHTRTVTMTATRPAQVIGVGLSWEVVTGDHLEVHVSGYLINVGDAAAHDVGLEIVLHQGGAVTEKRVAVGTIPPLGYRKVDAYIPYEGDELDMVEINVVWG